MNKEAFLSQYVDDEVWETCNHGDTVSFKVGTKIERHCKYCKRFLVKYEIVKNEDAEETSNREES